MLGVTQVAQRPWVGEQGDGAHHESDYLGLLQKPRPASSGGAVTEDRCCRILWREVGISGIEVTLMQF